MLKTHNIDYFIDVSKQFIVYSNHYNTIHDTNSTFNKYVDSYIYKQL